MRRFVRTFTEKHAQFTVVQDGELACFSVLRWETGARGPVQVGESFHYRHHRDSVDLARGLAVGFARKLAAESRQDRAIQERQ